MSASFINFMTDTTPRPSELFAALERLQNRPDDLARDRARLNDSLPPPCSSGTTTEPPSLPGSPEPLTEFERLSQLRKSNPAAQFHQQADKERARIIEQFDRRWDRRKVTLRYDNKVGDLTDNAKNNVKNYWVEQGIWNDEWTVYRLSSAWMHEEEPKPVTEYSPEPDPSSEPLTIPQPSPFTPSIGKPESRVKMKPVNEEQWAAHIQKTAASRPYPQFLYQISKEREWLEDEPFTGPVNLNQVAFQNIKESWIKQNIWDPEWVDMPGDTWMHESLAQSKPQRSNDVVDASKGATSSHAVDNDGGEPQQFSPCSLFGPAQSTNHEVRRNKEARIREKVHSLYSSVLFGVATSATHGLRRNEDAQIGDDGADTNRLAGMHQPRPAAKPCGPILVRFGEYLSLEETPSDTTTFGQAKPLQGRKRISGQTVDEIGTTPIAAGHAGGGRRSRRIVERRGTDKTTPYDKDTRVSSPRPRRSQRLKKRSAK